MPIFFLNDILHVVGQVPVIFEWPPKTGFTVLIDDMYFFHSI